MARHDETTERPDRLFAEGDQGGWPDEAWPDAPEPSWMADPLGDGGGTDSFAAVRTSDPEADPVLDPEVDPMDDTTTIPAFDLGSDTETVVVDLTGEQPVVVQRDRPGGRAGGGRPGPAGGRGTGRCPRRGRQPQRRTPPSRARTPSARGSCRRCRAPTAAAPSR